MQKGNLPYNPKNQNNARPMVLEQTWKDHDKTTFPFNPEFPAIKKKGRCVKVILNSGDRESPSTLTAARFNVTLPTSFIAKRLNLVVDSFIVATAPNSVSNLSLYPYYIRIADFKNPLSWASNISGTTGMVLLTTGTTYQNNSPREVGGGTLVDTTMFSRPITIEIWSPHFDTASANGVANAWSLALSLWDEGDD